MEITIKHNKIEFKLFLRILIVVLFIILLQYVIKANSHAFIKHEAEVTASMQCLDANGSNKAFKFYKSGEERRLWTCYDNIDWYIIVTTSITKGKGIDREYDLRTAYKLEDETIQQLEKRKLAEGYIKVDEQLEPLQQFFEWE